MSNADKDYHMITDFLLRDFWSISDACLIFAGAVRKDSAIYQIETGERVTASEKRKTNQEKIRLEEQWKNSDHDWSNTAVFKYSMDSKPMARRCRVSYLVKWALRQRVSLPWLDWAIEEGHLDNTIRSPDMGTNEPPKEPLEGFQNSKELDNRLRLVGVLKEMLLDAKLATDVPFKDQNQLTDYIYNSYGEDLPNKGLSKASLQQAFAAANKIRKKDTDI